MLAHIRAWSSSLVAKIIIGMIVLAFVLLAYAGSLTLRGGGPTETVAKVGDQVLQRQYLEASVRQQVAQYNQIPDFKIETMADYEERDPARQVVNSFIQSAMWPEQVNSLGIEASEAEVRDAIVRDPRFLREDGSFNEALFNTFALNNNRDAYMASLATQVVSSKIRGLPLAEDLELPAGWSQPIGAYLSEKRAVEGFWLPRESVSDIAVSDEQLATYLSDNQSAFMWPELRTAQVIAFTAEDTYERYDVEEERVLALYERRKDDANQPETRVIEQISVETLEQAQGYVERLRAGEQWPAIAFEATQAAPMSLGDVSADKLAPALADAAFKVLEPGILDPVASDEGATILRVLSITPAVEASLETMRPELERELKLVVAQRNLFDLSQELDFKLGDGISLEQAAADLDLPLVSLDQVDRLGRNKAGARAADIVANADIMAAVFAAKVDDENVVSTDETISYVVDLSAIEAPAPKTLDEARAELVAAYLNAEALKTMEAQAEALSARITSGEISMAAAASELGVELQSLEASTRNQAAQADPLFAGAIEAIFGAEGEGALLTQQQSARVALMQITAVEAGDAGEPSDVAKQTLAVLANSWQTDLSDAYTQALREAGNYRIINRVVNEVSEAVAIELGLQ